MTSLRSSIWLLGQLLLVRVSGRFNEQYYDTTSIPGHVVGVVDFNNDKMADLISVYYKEATKEHCVQIYLFNNQHYVLLDTAQQICEKVAITSVKVADFNYDGRPDLLVQGYDGTTRYAHIYLGYLTFLTNTATVIRPSPYNELSIIDVDDNLRPDLYGLILDSNGDKVRTIWQHSGVDEWQQPYYTSGTHILPDKHKYTTLCDGMEPVYIDLDGNCLMDQVIPVCLAGKESAALAHANAVTPESSPQAWEVWRNVKRAEYSNWAFQLEKVVPMPIGVQQPVVLDARGTGTLDIAAPLCLPLNSCASLSQIVIWENTQLPVCQSSLSSGCRKEDDMCRSDGGYSLPIHDLNQATVLSVAPFVLPDVSSDVMSYRNPPVLLHVGDVDQDGVPYFATSTVKGFVLMNSNLVTYTVTTSPSYAGAFLEISAGAKTRGRLAILVLRSHGGAGTFVDTSTDDNHYHLTTLASNGANINSRPYGTPAIGATFKFLVTQLNGRVVARQTTQAAGGPYLSLQTPYTISGLGASNQYLPRVYLGLPITSSTHYRSWSGVLPNSEIVVFPDSGSLLSEWVIELFVPMAENLRTVAIALGVAIFLNIIVIIFLRCRERALEKQQLQKQRHLFAF